MRTSCLYIPVFILFLGFITGGKVFSTPDWEPVSNLQYNMQIVARLQLPDGSPSLNPGDLVAGFVGDECRGMASPIPSADGIIFLTIGSNELSGEAITFKAYIANSDQVVELEQSLEFVSMGEVGTFLEPFVFTISDGDPITPPDWEPLPNLQYNMQIVATLELPDGVNSLSPDDIVAGFVGDECRGMASPLPSVEGRIFLTIGSNEQSGEMVTFKAYIADSGQIVTLDQNIEFENMSEVGTYFDPFVFTFIRDDDIAENLLIQNESILNGETACFSALQTITVSDFSVESGGSATLIAGERIHLLPGTVVKPGGYLHAYITQTDDYCVPVAKMEPVQEEVVTSIEIPEIRSEASFFKVFPNPTAGRFTLELDEFSDHDNVYVEVYSILGTRVISQEMPVEQQHILSLEGQQPGIYIIRVLLGDKVGIDRLIKK